MYCFKKKPFNFVINRLASIYKCFFIEQNHSKSQFQQNQKSKKLKN